MSDNWIVQNLNSALNTWNEKLAEIWTLLTQSPESFKGGTIWSVITGINGALTAIGYGLLVLFFFSRDRKDLWQLYRHEKAGTCPQSLYPVCTGLHHFFRLFCQSAGHWGYVLKCSDHCVELCRGIGIQPAGAGGCGESI